ncbi:hypothetical protein H6G74_19325 [Nostoc spongiaeforme FACHB-130]|uniref:Uncharacterized protein n=1 Tax=Nostoc spongiaeforme FACHB-130 TaxID=1357510 RepID=A0ABR8FYQ8_9NOSO|nr:hypothetical protein [Nostoc spongiaeforme]MBD2596466.1 hypothetical protein [Nostoc spongiaeforme FACHB-130]
MTELPANFDSWEHLQQTYMLEYNKRVDKFFSDVQGNGDLSGPRPSLKLACRLKDDDNIATWNLRTSLFFDVIGYSRKNLSIFYGSNLDITPPVAGHPQLFLYFSQDSQAVPANGKRLDHEKSCRLTRYACKSGEALPAVTKANLLDIAREIKQQFMEGQKGITYTAGKLAVSYTDPINGFPRGGRWLVNSKSEAITLYQKLCNVIDRPFEINKVNVNTPEKDSTSSTSTQNETVLGKQYKKAAYRPVANLRFRYAYVSFGGTVPSIFLIDTTYKNTALLA